ncbi:MAG: hypothetical protein LC104_02275 [Bacteroidales bacterium]|nr:hypothetical protein [Bacteroidales bacterium]
MFGQLGHRSLPPASSTDAIADVFPDTPVKLDQRRVDGGNGTNPRGVDQPQDFIEVAVLWGTCLASWDKLPFGVSG